MLADEASGVQDCSVVQEPSLDAVTQVVEMPAAMADVTLDAAKVLYSAMQGCLPCQQWAVETTVAELAEPFAVDASSDWVVVCETPDTHTVVRFLTRCLHKGWAALLLHLRTLTRTTPLEVLVTS